MEEIREGQHLSAGPDSPEPIPEGPLDLKATREALGLSLHDIFRQTRVSLINLTAVENLDFAKLPPPVYARDYLRKYARAVGIDAQPLLNRYEKHLESLNPPAEETEVRKPWPENGRRYRFLFTALGAIIAAGLLVYALYLYDQGEKSLSPAAPAPIEQQAAESAAPPAEPVAPPAEGLPSSEPAATIFEAREPAASPVKAPLSSPAPLAVPPVATGTKHHLVIEAREVTWVRITQDGTPRQVLLQPGERIERSADDSFLLDVGNAGGITVTYQGKVLPPLGKPGEVVHLRLPEKPQEP